MKPGTLFQYRKDPRVIVTVPILIVVLTSLVYYLIQRTQELTPEALSSRLLLFVLWNINLLLVLGILFVLLRMGVKLLLERQRGILGSRFRTKLVATYIVTSLFPILLLFLVATDLLRVSIDRWFNMPVRRVLANSEEIARAAEDRVIRQSRLASEELRESIAAGEGAESLLEHVRRYHAVDLAGIYEQRAISTMTGNPRVPIHELPELSDRFLSEVETRGSQQRIDVTRSGKWIRTATRIDRDRLAVTGSFIPNSLSRLIDENVIANNAFLQLDAQKTSLKATQTSLFLAFTLAILFGAIWMAIYISRRITVPVQALAEGTRTLAKGEFGHRIELQAGDEFGLLINSFNTMAGQLEQQRMALTDSNQELLTLNTRLDDERAFLSTVLESVSSGIIALSEDHRILTINPSAMRILQVGRDSFGRSASEVFRGELEPISQFLSELGGDRAPRAREVSIVRNGELHYLELSAARLSERRRGGAWVVAMEDSTQLVQAQKLAAWSEAARRIAHEIKNPLTPIQLSAERILKKSRRDDPEVRSAIESGCSTIVSEVSHLKRMVDEFSRFARMPAIHLERTDLKPVLASAASLYEHVKPGVSIRIDAPDDLQATVDREQIRRALINLLDNAIEATDSGTISIAAARTDGSLRISVSDPGRGVPDTDKEKLFLPYFSTKGRGTGLGLAIVHRIVNDHDGTITVHDNTPRGTRFEIDLPA